MNNPTSVSGSFLLAARLTAMKNGKHIDGQDGSWDPNVLNANWEDTEFKLVRNGTKTVYEWRIGIGEALVPGRSIGLDHLICDTDEGDGPGDGKTTFWGSYTSKSRGASRIGDLVLVREGARLGKLAGRITWASSEPNTNRTGDRKPEDGESDDGETEQGLRLPKKIQDHLRRRSALLDSRTDGR